ncbi:MAG TPA: ABC transporter ATP-binding protein [Spirochaetales bacterium]|nr:ABC transporter ATP-binding protein [Spirochaetales bacterium]HRY53819.1 ABC transporter ATP-binding protein [Spirochaetia bacterium]HRZ65094.1 ABC transporter ATP-binding protein [Spirochaetia bacterium]
MSELVLKDLEIRYGKVTALDRLNLSIKDGELVTLLGPSGCGKTTTLRAVSGFLAPQGGDIFIGGRRITDIPPEKRGIGLVFQNYALWPHMTVFKNLAFGLEMRKIPAEEIKRRVAAVLASVQLSEYADRLPRQLSGGQQQRIALARAIVLEPDILLLDEPLSNLDALLREQMRFEIAAIHDRLGITTMYVTHDQTEAMVISDRIVIMRKGLVMQDGPPEEIYRRPANKFVAGFMGTTSFVPGAVVGVEGERCEIETAEGLRLVGLGSGLKLGDRACAAVRPEAVLLGKRGAEEPEGRGANRFEAVVQRSNFTGELVDYQLKVGSCFLRAKEPETRKVHGCGERVELRISAERLPIVADADAEPRAV